MNTQSLIERIITREAVVGVIGLGYLGLPLVLEFCRASFRVLGIDVDSEKITALNQGNSYIRHIPSSEVKQFSNIGTLRATSDFARIPEADAILICVPTPLTKYREPDLTFIEKTGRQIATQLRRGQLVVLESSTYQGMTDEVLCDIIETSGLKPGKNFFLAYLPEREDPRKPAFSTGKIPKVVGDSIRIRSRPRTRFTARWWCRQFGCPRRARPKRSNCSRTYSVA